MEAISHRPSPIDNQIVVTISITAEAHAAIAATLPKGRAAKPPQPDGRGGLLITLDRAMADRPGARRRPGESYSDVILGLAGPRS